MKTDTSINDIGATGWNSERIGAAGTLDLGRFRCVVAVSVNHPIAGRHCSSNRLVTFAGLHAWRVFRASDAFRICDGFLCTLFGLLGNSEPAMDSALEKRAKRHELVVVKPANSREPVWNWQRQPMIPADEVLWNLAKRHGAQRVPVATAEKNARPLSYRYAGYSEGPPWLTTVYDPTIPIRSLGGPSLQQVERRAEANAQKKENCLVRQHDQ